ncbi:Tautomerase/MIF superfamily [Flagelloscypha sp. PMI_526]|nr:Tautomerase/MIF superfamily [Flagelloscypha sp. PMI_526]
MPSLSLVTNVKIDDAKAFALEFAQRSAEILGKPLGYITTNITYNETLNFAGSFDPAFDLRVVSLDNLSPDQNEKYSKEFSAFLSEKLGLKADRGYILFQDPGRTHLGYQGTTFATIFKS